MATAFSLGRERQENWRIREVKNKRSSISLLEYGIARITLATGFWKLCGEHMVAGFNYRTYADVLGNGPVKESKS